MMVFNFIIDLVFISDIIIVFRTSVLCGTTGDEITDTRVIARRYLCSTRFPLDILAAFPFDFVIWATDINGEFFQALGFLKISRILRLNKIITFM